MTVNFILFWAVPIAGMGLLWKHALKFFLQPVYDAMDNHKGLRSFATKYIYAKPEYADFFAISILLVVNSALTVGLLFYWQLSTGHLPWWLVAFYYCSWVGVGGRMMGAAYALAHKEVCAKTAKTASNIFRKNQIESVVCRACRGTIMPCTKNG